MFPSSSGLPTSRAHLLRAIIRLADKVVEHLGPQLRVAALGRVAVLYHRTDERRDVALSHVHLHRQ